MQTTRRTALVDLSNCLMIIRHAALPKDKREDDYGAQLMFRETLTMICDIVKTYKATDVVVAGEGTNKWRKAFYEHYKANRQIETDLYYPEINRAREYLLEFFDLYTNWSVVTSERAEADDVIAVAVQSDPDREFVIISSDKDFMQLLREGVILYSPMGRKEREIEDDRDFDLFLKCIRGDSSDNVRSAYPRIYTKKLKEIWNDKTKYGMQNLMEHRLDSGERVGDLYQRNKTLIDLTQQPENIRADIMQQLGTASTCNYRHISCLRFLRDIDLAEFGSDFDRISKTLQLRD